MGELVTGSYPCNFGTELCPWEGLIKPLYSAYMRGAGTFYLYRVYGLAGAPAKYAACYGRPDEGYAIQWSDSVHDLHEWLVQVTGDTSPRRHA